MQALIEMIIGFIALLAAAALSQFGLQLDAPETSQREIHRVRDCGEQPAGAILAIAERKQDC
ncbi:MAG: hypothetical protein KKG14_08395 [Alphaproteobacteria bacterium]|nr:hypothetical protein [Alphaproteobacteria bacterium]MBU2271000.1 hypothetical protein [Alphaproteobacteria bacterium]MBU2418709.1 hypothetical protein [Alphaproteobacteria bacterium]